MRDSLLAVSVSSPGAGDRQQPLHSCKWRPSTTLTMQVFGGPFTQGDVSVLSATVGYAPPTVRVVTDHWFNGPMVTNSDQWSAIWAKSPKVVS